MTLYTRDEAAARLTVSLSTLKLEIAAGHI